MAVISNLGTVEKNYQEKCGWYGKKASLQFNKDLERFGLTGTVVQGKKIHGLRAASPFGVQTEHPVVAATQECLRKGVEFKIEIDLENPVTTFLPERDQSGVQRVINWLNITSCTPVPTRPGATKATRSTKTKDEPIPGWDSTPTIDA